MVSGRTIKLKSINWMEIYHTIAMTSNTNLSFIKLTFNLNNLEANRKRFVPYSVIEYTNSIFLQSITSTMRQTVVILVKIYDYSNSTIMKFNCTIHVLYT